MWNPELCTSVQDCKKLQAVRWAGTWQLAPGRALSLMPRKSSQLVIMYGCAWITGDGVRLPATERGDDFFLESGQVIEVAAGTHLVIESRNPGQLLQIDWREMPPGLAERHTACAALPLLAWQWVRALGHLGQATACLLAGLARTQGKSGRSSAASQLPA